MNCYDFVLRERKNIITMLTSVNATWLMRIDLFICLPKNECRLLPFYYAKRVSFAYIIYFVCYESDTHRLLFAVDFFFHCFCLSLSPSLSLDFGVTVCDLVVSLLFSLVCLQFHGMKVSTKCTCRITFSGARNKRPMKIVMFTI